MRCSASWVSVDVREAALPSTTSSGISLHGDADDVLPAAHVVDREIDLLRGPDQLELERAIGFVLEGAPGEDVQPAGANDVLDDVESDLALHADRRVHLATAIEEISLDRPEADEHQNDEHGRADAFDIRAGTDRRAHRRD